MPSPDHQGAPWLATMRELAGTKEFPGGANNPTILGWARFIGTTYPEMSRYTDNYQHDKTPWCGLTMAYALAKNGIKPPFGDGDLKRFLWANSFATDPAYLRTDPRPGAIVVFDWRNGSGHVGIVDHIDNAKVWVSGGNQADAVNVAAFNRDGHVVGYFWPEKVAAAPAPVSTPADVRRRMGKAITLAEAVRDDAGHIKVVVPAVGNGGAYEVAGITEKHHPVAAAKLKALIEGRRHQEAEDFIGDYTGSYTDVADVWTVSWGIEFYLRDSSFHHGPTGAAKIMQRALKLRGEPLDESGPNRDGVDGDVGPVTSEAMRRQEVNVEAMLVALRQAREDYQAEKGFGEFRNGLINRFNNALTVARRFHAEQPKESLVADTPAPPVSVPQSPVPPIADFPGVGVGVDPKKMQDVLQVAMIAMLVVQMMQGKQIQIPNSGLTPNTQPGPVAQPEAPAPPPPPPATDTTNNGADLWAKILGFAGLVGTAVGAGTGQAPLIGAEPGAVAPMVAGASLLTLAGGILGIFNPTLGGIVKGLGGAFSGARQAFQQPTQNPPTR